jgi:CheY-like chemotaxis protein
MPGMSGLELLQRVRKESESPPAPHVMMLTAYGDADVFQQAKELGANDLLTKPVDFALLKEKLNSLTAA